jgi:hypothetical protein
MHYCVKDQSVPTPAIDLYSGNFYKSLNKPLLKDFMLANHLQIYILSAGYGVVHALDPVQNYDAEMKGPVAQFWRDNGIIDYIASLSANAEKVFGFFAGEPNWSGPHAKYRFFFTEGVKRAIQKEGRISEAGCFYRGEGRGANPILTALGRSFMDSIASGFSYELIQQAIHTGLVYHMPKKIVVKYDQFISGRGS